MRNLKTIITFIYLSLIFSVEVEEFYILYDKKNMNQNLYRPKISKDNTYISAEIHTFMSDIKDGYNNDMTIIFDNSESKDNLNGFYIKDKTDDDGALSKTTNIEWSKQTDNLFFSTKFVDSDEDDNIEHSLFFNRLDSLYKDSNIASVTQANLNNFDKRLGLNYGKPSKINKYTISTPSDIEIDRTDNKWLTQLPIVHIIHNSQDNKTHSISTNHSSSKLNKVDVDINVLDMDVTLQRNEINEFKNSYNFLLTEEHNIYQSSIYLSCSMSSRNFLLQLYPNNQSKMSNQIEPTFNHNGTKAAFLSQSNDIGKHFDLYVVDIEECWDCGHFNDKYYDDPTKLNYTKIDNYIVNDDYKDTLPITRTKFTSYCWHPTKNILFYIKRDDYKRDQNKDFQSYSIYYHDLDNNDGPKALNLPTDHNKYIDISEDGQYLIFSFKTVKNEYKNKYKKIYGNDFITNSFHKIGAAKLSYD